MPELSVLLVFSLAAAMLIVVPGPNVIYIVTRSISQGRNAGLVSAAAVQSGIFIHVLAAVLGISAVVASSAMALNALKYLGAAYLAYLGIRTLLSREGDSTDAVPRPRAEGWKRIYAEGFFISTANPKVALFFLAFLPQFADPERGPVASQMLILGCIFLLIALLSDSAYALGAGALGAWLRQRPGVVRWQHRVTGLVYLALAATTAVSQVGRSSSGRTG